MKASELLRKAVELPWCKGHMATNEQGHYCIVHSDFAHSFCSLGRIERLRTGEKNEELAIFYLSKALYSHPEFELLDIAKWNDTPSRTREEVDAAFLKAAELAEKDGQ